MKLKTVRPELDKTLIGLHIEEAYKKINSIEDLSSNLIRNEETGKVEINRMARIMLLLPNHITVSTDKNGIITATKRG